ncbi:hypothetical protein [Kitasatospora sp. NPDC088548]|uniref:hypothetical protein n=1 Tax=Kitasatospora sp. NPDC088548 TaxID=3364075 RepID=UPI00382E6854
MSTAARPKVGRSYTRARRHPWVLGRLGDFRLPMGPYTPMQLGIAAVGSFTLIKTAAWWAPTLGPVPVIVWAVAIWAARHPRIGGRSPGPALLDALALAVAPKSGRIGGRAVRPLPEQWLHGGFGIEEAEPADRAEPAPAPVAAESAAKKPAARPAPRSRPAPAAAATRPRPRNAAARPGPRPASTAQPGTGPGPAPTALELLLAQAAGNSQQTSTTRKAGTRR